jgi:toxin ParE1/3/4
VGKYQLSRAADTDLSEIYVYSYRESGEHHADAYFESLEASLSKVAENPLLGVHVGSLRQGYRRLVHKKHSIYYKIAKPGILIVRILGPGMSAESNLP